MERQSLRYPEAAMRCAAFAMTLVVLATTARAQQRPGSVDASDTGVIKGRVVRSDTRQPLRRAQVRLFAPESHAVLTDDNGRYEITQLPAGRHTLAASKGGFVQMTYGQRRPHGPGRPLTLAAGQVLEDIDFLLPPGGVITGRIADEAGESVVGAEVSVMRFAFINGTRQLTGVGGARTDDRGEFRIFGLPRGEYVVQASFGAAGDLSGVGVGYAPTFYPGTPVHGEAQRVAIKAGEEIAGITFALSRTRTASVSGVVRDPDGSTTMAVVLARENSANVPRMGSEGFAVAKPDGTFQISNLQPGSYVLDARDMANPNQSGRTEVVINERDVTGIVIDITKGVTARGRIRFDTSDSPKRLKPDQVRLFASSLDPTEMGMTIDRMPPHVREDWTFELTGLRGRRTIGAVIFQGEWTTKTISVGGTDVTDTGIDFRNADVDGIDLVLTQQKTDLSGLVTDGRGNRVTNATVVAFADDSEKWSPAGGMVRRAELDQDGRYRIERLRPAEYLVIAVDELEPNEEFDPELLEQYRRLGTRITLHDGETRTLDLKLTVY
jgi:hypothetical protein